MAKGSNDLNMLLKAQVVKIRAELDLKSSMPTIRKQVDMITDRLKNKPVKLKVQLDYKLTELRMQMKRLESALFSARSIKPIRIGVEIDVKGSAQNIKRQLQEIHRTVSDFNKRYGEQIKKMQQQTQQAGRTVASGLASPNINSAIAGFDMRIFTSQINEAKRQMKDMFGKGIFSSFEMKDAEGNLRGFVAQLEKQNGVIQKIKYQWNAEAGKFTPISQETVSTTERHVNKAIQSLRSLQSEMMKLRDGNAKNNLWSDYNDLEKRASSGTLTQDAVRSLKQRIKDEQTLQQVINKENRDLQEQKKLIMDIEKARSRSWSKTGDTAIRQEYNNALRSAKGDGSAENLKAQRLELQRINELSSQISRKDAEHIANTKRKLQISQQLRQIESKTVSTDRTSQALISEIKLMNQRARTAQDYIAIQQRMNTLRTSNRNDLDMQRALDMQLKVRQQLERLVNLGRMTSEQFNRAMSQIPITASRNVADLERQYRLLNRRVKEANEELRKEAESRVKILMDSSTGGNNLGKIRNAVDAGDVQSLQRYLGEIYKGRVETVRMEQTTDSLGRSVDRLKVKMAGAGKTVRTYTVDLDRANNSLRQVAQGTDYNANRNLGIFEQLRIAMSRVPVWMVAMSAFYGTLRGVREAVNEIIEIDTLLTNINRVASDSININAIFSGAVNLSKELGNNLHDILDSLGQFARTYGDFNERQLLAITRTTTMMSNVSELTAQEATESLVGTMNAFNITAEDSIRIVDALNEVDNNYAISTKQLAESLSKSASAAKTFGVTMEENIGHTTAIGSVTMESGRQIGNGLKTIYSRITTLSGVEEILNSVGVAVKRIGENGEEVRPVNDILTELAGKWDTLTDSQRQNIAVEVAGRYQLTRFLALMSNYDTALQSTNTAVYSHGSALRENAKYMQSFESRINQLKNSFSQVALSIGDAMLSGAMLGAIELLGKLASMAVTVSEKLGVLPAVFLAIVAVMGKMGVFNKLHASIVGIFSTMQVHAGIASSAVGGLRGQFIGAGAGAVAFGQQVRAGMASAVTAVRGFGITWKSVMASTVIGGAFVLVGIGIEKLVSMFQDAKQKAEELEETNKKLVSSYRELGREDGVNQLIDKYDRLSSKSRLTAEEQEELQRATADLANQFPTMVEYIDAQGNAHLKTVDAMREQVGVAKELSKAQADIASAKFSQNIQDQAKAYQDVQKELDKIMDKAEKLRKEDGTFFSGIGRDGRGAGIRDNTLKMAETEMERILKQAELREIVQDTIVTIKEASLAWLEQEGMLSNLGDAQQKVVENFISLNHEMLTSSNNSTEVQTKLFELGNKVGEVFSKAQKEVKDAVENMDLTPAEKLQEIDKIEKKFSEVAKAIPKDLFVLDEDGNIDKTVSKIEKLVDVAKNVDDNTSFVDLKQQLIDTGLSADQAGQFIADFAKQQELTTLRAQAQKEGYEGVNEELDVLQENILETIDLTKEMLGYSGGDLEAIESYLQYMDLLIARYGEAGKSSEEYVQAEIALAERLGITSEELNKNRDVIRQRSEDFRNIDFSAFDASKQSFSEWVKSLEDVDRPIKEWLLNLEYGQDALTGVKNETKELTEATDGQKSSNEELTASQEALKQNTEELKQTFETTKQSMNDTTRNEWIETMRTQLSSLGDNIKIVQDKTGELKFAMSDGSSNPYIDTLMGQISDLGMKLELAKNDMGEFRLSLVDSSGGRYFIDTFSDKVDGFNVKIDESVTNVGKLNDVKAEPEINVDFDNLTDGLGNVMSSLEGLQGAFDKLKGNIEKLGDIKSVLNDLKGLADTLRDSLSSIFSGSKGDFDNLISKAKEAKNAVDDLKRSLDKIKNLAGRIDVKGIENIRDYAKKASSSVQTMADDLNDIPSKVGKVSKGISNHLGKAEDSIKDAGKASKNLGKEYGKLENSVSKDFASMRRSVESNTSKMISQHSSQRTALDNLARSARLARTDISNLNDQARSAMNSLDRYSSKVSSARSTANSSRGTFNSPFTPFSSSNVFSSANTFSALAEGMGSGGESSGDSGMGSSGIMRQSIYDVVTNSENGYMFNALALDTLVRPNYRERQITAWNGVVSQLETRMQRLNKYSQEYKNAMQQVITYQNKILANSQKELKVLERRNIVINQRLKQLSNVSKHTEKQRKEYNDLQNEYEQNLSKIASLKGEVESLINDVRNKTVELFSDIIDEIKETYDKAIDAIKKRTENIDFKLEILELTDPDNQNARVDLIADKIRELIKERSEYERARKQLESQLLTATRRYGKESDIVKSMVEELERLKGAWQDTTLAILRAEKEIRDIRGGIADDIINKIKSSYEEIKRNAIKTKDVEIENAKKAHQEKMKFYDEEIKRISEIYDARIKALDDEASEMDYNEKLAEMNKELSELMNLESVYLRDDSLDGRKRLSETQKEISDLQKEIDKFMRDRQRELLKEQLQDQKQFELDKLQARKDSDEEANNSRIEHLEEEKQALSDYYDSIISDEKRWTNIREELIKGNFSVLNSELVNMGINIQQSSNGIFDTLSDNFASYSDEVRSFVNEINQMIRQINDMTNFSPNINDHGNMIDMGRTTKIEEIPHLINAVYSGRELHDPTQEKTYIYDLIKESGLSRQVMTEIWEKARKGTALDAPTPEKLMFYNMFLEIIRRAKIGSFDTGGYTGDWGTNSGKLAILHKKELVLNEGQTSDLLDTIKILDNIMSPTIKPQNNIAREIATQGVTNIHNIYELSVNIESLNGNKSGAKLVAREVMNGLKKLGK